MSLKTDFMVERGFYSLTPERKALICNGAGASGDWRSAFIPNTLWGLDCTVVFDIHDYAYYVGITYMDKLRADVHMLVNLVLLITGKGGILFSLRMYRAATYFSFVHRLGGNAFFTSKKGNKHLNRRSQ